MLNIVIPMAGRGTRFSAKGYKEPKPFIPVHGKPMIQLVIENVRPKMDHRFHFLCLQEHLESFDVRGLLEHIAPGCVIIPVLGVTEGAACTVLLARDWIDNDQPLMIANSDQYMDTDINEYLAIMDREKTDGLIMTFWADDTKWSYVRFDQTGAVCEVVEKKVVSNEATVGIYNFKRGHDFISAADRMIAKNLRVNNEFYVAPVYNMMIEKGAKIMVHNIGRENKGMYGMGSPDDLEIFIKSAISKKAAGLS